MEPGGKILIRIAWDGTHISRVTVVPRDSIAPAGLLGGRTGQQAVNMIPLLFSLCGKAQGVAGVMALEAATGTTVPPQTETWRNRLVKAETIQESLWRLLLDLPKLAGRDPAIAPYVGLRRIFASGLVGILATDNWKTAGERIGPPDPSAWLALAEEVEAFVAQQVLGMPTQQWLAIQTPGEVETWLGGCATPVVASMGDILRDADSSVAANVPLLLSPDGPEVLEYIVPRLEVEESFARCPEWCGAPAETGPIARMHSHPLLSALSRQGCPGVFVRLLARLLEIATLVAGLNADQGGLSWLDSIRVRADVGVAWVQTARGLLIHLLRLEHGSVADYRILAPTEWNFHPDGAYVRGLLGTRASTPDRAREAAELLMLALDPCVAYEIEVNDA